MKPIHWDDGTRFDDPNAYWGFRLEPGDPGYVVPAPSPDESTHTNRRTMSSNATPPNRNVLQALARKMHSGQIVHEATVGLHHHLAAAMDAALKALEGDGAAAPGSAASKGAQLIYREAVHDTNDAEAALKALSNGAVKTWLDGYRKVIEGIHGAKASANWQSAGFPAGTTAVPRKHDERLTLLTAARAYLAGHASYEVSLPQASGTPLAITAAQALALRGSMVTAQTLIATRETAQTDAKTTRDADESALFTEVSETIAELRDLLSDTDPRWELFGLNIPANPNPPEGVSDLTLTAAGPGRELATWSYAVRAEYYRLFLKRVGTDPEFVNLTDPKDLEFTLKDLTPGSTIEVYLIPANDGGEGPASPTVTKVVGA